MGARFTRPGPRRQAISLSLPGVRGLARVAGARANLSGTQRPRATVGRSDGAAGRQCRAQRHVEKAQPATRLGHGLHDDRGAAQRAGDLRRAYGGPVRLEPEEQPPGKKEEDDSGEKSGG